MGRGNNRDDKSQRKSSGGGFRPDFGGFQQRSFSSAPREMHKATCADCGSECEVPFKPSGERPVYCRACYSKHAPKRF